MRFFASCWGRLPKRAVATAVVTLIVGFSFISPASGVLHLLAGRTNWGWS